MQFWRMGAALTCLAALMVDARTFAAWYLAFSSATFSSMAALPRYAARNSSKSVYGAFLFCVSILFKECLKTFLFCMPHSSSVCQSILCLYSFEEYLWNIHILCV
jgi:hypothetical protein